MNKYYIILTGLLALNSTARAMDTENGPDYRTIAQKEFKNLVHTQNTPALVNFFKFGPVAYLSLPDFLFLETALKHDTWAPTTELEHLLDTRIKLEEIILATVYN